MTSGEIIALPMVLNATYATEGTIGQAVKSAQWQGSQEGSTLCGVWIRLK